MKKQCLLLKDIDLYGTLAVKGSKIDYDLRFPNGFFIKWDFEHGGINLKEGIDAEDCQPSHITKPGELFAKWGEEKEKRKKLEKQLARAMDVLVDCHHLKSGWSKRVALILKSSGVIK